MFRKWGIATKSTVPGVLIAVLACSAAYFVIFAQQRQLAIDGAVRTARVVSNQVAADRQVYSGEVVGKLKRDGLAVVPANQATYRSITGGIPLPATFVHATSDAVNKGKNKTHTIDLLSLWNINKVKGPRSAWEEHALRQVADSPEEVASQVQGSGASARLHVVTADRGTASSCITCHNQHPESPRRDFRLGDVMGGLVVSLPLAGEFAAAQSNALVLTGLLAAGFFILLLLQWLLVNRKLVRDIAQLEEAARKISLGEMDAPIPHRRTDEIGDLAIAFERMRTSVREAMNQFQA